MYFKQIRRFSNKNFLDNSTIHIRLSSIFWICKCNTLILTVKNGRNKTKSLLIFNISYYKSNKEKELYLKGNEPNEKMPYLNQIQMKTLFLIAC